MGNQAQTSNVPEINVDELNKTKTFYRQRIELAKLQKEYSQLNADIAEAQAREAYAYGSLAQFTAHPKDSEDTTPATADTKPQPTTPQA